MATKSTIALAQCACGAGIFIAGVTQCTVCARVKNWSMARPKPPAPYRVPKPIDWERVFAYEELFEEMSQNETH